VVVWLRLPDVPRTVTVNVPVLAELLAVNLKLLVPVVVAGLKDAVTPLGKPDADRLTLPKKPFWGLTATVLVPLDPCVTLTLLGESKSAKSPVLDDGFTVSVTKTEFTRLPEAPVIVTVEVPVAAVLLAVNVRTSVVLLVPALQPEDTPFGKVESATETVPVKPFTGTSAIVVEPPAPPGVIARLFGVAVNEKFGVDAALLTVKLIEAVWVKLPETPVMVMVEVPVAAVLPAVRVSVLVLVALAGLNDAVTPLGRPEADKAALPLNPF
jgi:hypothetical protein